MANNFKKPLKDWKSTKYLNFHFYNDFNLYTNKNK